MLEQILSFDFADRAVHAHDASMYRLMPQAVARPQSESDVLKLIAWAREARTGLTFRTGGTSLSGQAVTHGVLVLLGRSWDYINISDQGDLISCGPALRGGVANAHLAKYSRKIGPDPASLQAACLGGIVANNASGMCCGVEENSYQTLHGLKLVLASGLQIDTRLKGCEEEFREKSPSVYSGLLSLRDKILASTRLVELIRRKSAGKNTTGYGLQAFLDFSSASEILSHIMVGSEGTLGFISEISLRTVPLRPHRASALLSFGRLEDACALTTELRAAGCSAIELLDFASVQALLGRPGVPGFLNTLTPEGACLLVQIQKDAQQDLQESVQNNLKMFDHKSVQHRTPFFADKIQQTNLWDLRKGIFPAVGARRPKGTSVIIEDVAFPLERLPSGTRDLRALLNKHAYHDAVIYGHARDGNLHFVLAQDFSVQAEVKRYENFVDEMVDCVAGVHGGALKAEHGTGRNMAPFVEKEWGSEAYAIMRELKRILDPENIFNPGVILNSNARVHLENLKTLPLVDEKLDACIECGFCEPVCPSQGFTQSPRGRIVLEREKRLYRESMLSEPSATKYAQLDTCAADGLCARACPVGINTGEWVKDMRSQGARHYQHALASWAAANTSAAETAVSISLAAAKGVSTVLGAPMISKMSRVFNETIGTPIWTESISGTSADRAADVNLSEEKLEIILFQSCVTRTCGSTQHTPLNESSILTCSRRAGIHFKLVSEKGQCCGQPWSSKGFKAQAQEKLSALIHFLHEESRAGEIPVVIDNSPCAATVFEDVGQLSADSQQKFHRMTFLDPLAYAQHLLPKLKIQPIRESSRFFPVCSVRKSGQVSQFEELAKQLCERPIFPHQEACCGMAGDRGLWIPALTENATKRFHWDTEPAVQGYCTSRTCEVALSDKGTAFGSIFDALERASRPVMTTAQ